MDLVVTDIDEASGVAMVTLNRPEARNATSIALLDAMDEAFDHIQAALDSLQVLILAGAGPSFCAGLDLAEVQATPEVIHRLLRRLSEVMRRLRRLPVATIARVQGAAIGGGFGLLAAADFALTHPEAKIGYPPLETCLSPALMAPWLIRKVGASRARSMLLAGGTMTGREAFEAGIVMQLVEENHLPEAAATLAEELTRGSMHALRAMKSLLNDLDGSNDDAMLDRAAEVSAEVMAEEETQRRLRRLFSERR